jgi:hypothetical protein
LPIALCAHHTNARLDGRPAVLGVGVGVDEHGVLAGLRDGHRHEVHRPSRIELSHFRLVRRSIGADDAHNNALARPVDRCAVHIARHDRGQ